FDPFLTAAANGLSAGVHFDENDIKGTKPAKVVYEDGSSQLMYPTVHKPADFFKAALKIAGVEAVQMNADGTLAVLFEGKKFQLEPSFNVKESPLPKDEDSVEPKIEINPDGTIDYTIQNEQALLTIPLNIIAK
ncbi:MAG: hypothetical protein KAG10_10860, partial [Methylococcales bacterium]|nr:hypothetical protein [Methylococcales bacterium]